MHTQDFRRSALDMDDDRGILKYDVDFFAADKDFEYDIDAATGAVIKAEREMMDAEDYAEMKAIKESMKTKEAAKAAGLNEEGALDIALKHAGVAKRQRAMSHARMFTSILMTIWAKKYLMLSSM